MKTMIFKKLIYKLPKYIVPSRIKINNQKLAISLKKFN